MITTTTTTRSKVASEVQDDMFDNWGDDGFGEYDFGDLGEDEGPEVRVAKCHGPITDTYICVKMCPKVEN